MSLQPDPTQAHATPVRAPRRTAVRAPALMLTAGLCAALFAWPATAQDGSRTAERNARLAQVQDAEIARDIAAYRDRLVARGGFTEEQIEDLVVQRFERIGIGEERIRRILAGDFQGGGFAQDPGETPAQPDDQNTAPVTADPAATIGTDSEASGSFTDSETIKLAFVEPITLDTLIDIISRELEINVVFQDPQLANQTVLIRAPIEVPTDELLLLLSTLLADRGFAIVEGDNAFYRIVQATNTPVEVGGVLATTRIIPTPNLRPSGLQTMLDTVLTGGAPSPGTPAGNRTVRFTPLDELGLLVVTGEATRLARVQELIDLLVEARRNQRLHLLPVEHVAASFARERMLELQGQISQGAAGQFIPGRTPTPVPGRPGVSIAGASTDLSRLAERLYVHSGNTLLFRGTGDELREVEDLLRVVDEVSPLIAKRYQTGIVTAELVEAAERLGLGTAAVVEGIGGDDTLRSFQRQGLANQATDSGVTVGDSRFQVDPDNGTVVYFGTESQHERFGEMVEQFRADMIDNGTQIRVYKLLYASAGERSIGGGEEGGEAETDPGLASLLEDLIRDPSNQRVEGRFTQGGTTGDGFSAAEDALLAGQAAPGADSLSLAVESALGGTRLAATEENTVIVADVTRNQIIIKAPALAHQQFEKIISQLDRRRSSVLIEVRIVSLTTNEGFDWQTAYDFEIGQFNLTALLGAGAPAEGANNLVESITVNAINPGLTAGLIKSEYVPFAINTLETIGDTRVVSEPRVLVNDNYRATFDSFTEVGIQEISQNANTTTTGQAGTAEAGTELEVTPRVSGAGEVTLELSIQLSDFTGEATEGLQPPAQRDIFNTEVTLPTNSTIVVGGFSLSRDQEAEAGIPLLKDIPWVGNLFKDISIERDNRTIFLFITPTIIDQDDDLSLKLRSEGPLAQAGYDDGTPSFDPVLIRVNPERDRLREALEGAELPQAGEAR